MHVVRRGDTLWDLAEFYLTDPFLWPAIYRLNTMVVEDPHWIYPAEELVLPLPGEVIAERPVPEEERVPGEEERVPIPEVPVEVPPQEVPQVAEGARTVFVPPDIRTTTLTYEPIPPVPPMAVTEGDFYRAGMLLPLAELGPRGVVVDAAMPHNAETSSIDLTNRYEQIYVSHAGGEAPEPGDRVLLTRIEDRVRPYGRIVRPTGIAVIVAVHEEVSTAVITHVFDKIQVGNTVTGLEFFEMERGVFAEAVPSGPEGELVALLDNQFVPGVGDYAFVNVGRDQGLVLGDEFEVYVSDRESRLGYRVPEEPIAEGRVVRVTERTATIRLFKQEHPSIAIGLPVRLIRKMPS
ncbi:MAG: LysM peptidoglycan-binding domain-containing protein [Gemmatimonadetes bacterium]|uniref:LysM peptidoglycan-binding domain-containing protein n=1 Tax=Candidatus Kutchimonas denitrificans TaxID=3056748 RepID=A0AAE4Z6H5_9BACT|nr:LysM peptidoglycan-binding domain-containing protein [Gemmatimonadota bacterium]NIR73903.1 LysM peptidoglycan-binding domain-containing protein [Candidatus Kutchimonas denitrificans]NIR99709.1 LysM peptidoglycan-binding domain-containing protein [Gemmatimonadota bacterium]NIT65294.1 LysM peptidoglycan-binding domain-containing protein [Gemmatimonadota bacterium]NIW73743.1 LysM peptidoglycan-binding domain-containing protein [Gemmatimonadota bacterium]